MTAAQRVAIVTIVAGLLLGGYGLGFRHGADAESERTCDQYVARGFR